MRVIVRRTLREFWEAGHRDAEQPLKTWYAETERALWKSPEDVKARHANASIVARNRVVFDIGGNKYRLVVAMKYELGVAYVRFVGTHAEYDRVNVEEI